MSKFFVKSISFHIIRLRFNNLFCKPLMCHLYPILPRLDEEASPLIADFYRKANRDRYKSYVCSDCPVWTTLSLKTNSCSWAQNPTRIKAKWVIDSTPCEMDMHAKVAVSCIKLQDQQREMFYYKATWKKTPRHYEHSHLTSLFLAIKDSLGILWDLPTTVK